MITLIRVEIEIDDTKRDVKVEVENPSAVEVAMFFLSLHEAKKKIMKEWKECEKRNQSDSSD